LVREKTTVAPDTQRAREKTYPTKGRIAAPNRRIIVGGRQSRLSEVPMSDQPSLPAIPAPPRPRDIPPEAKRAIADAIIAELLAASLLREGERASAAADIVAVARQHMDGYQIARKLEDCGWHCCMEIAQALDAYGSHHSEALLAAERAWAAAHNIQPRIAAGTPVRAKVGFEWRDGVLHGVATHHAARYLVRDAADPPDVKRHWVVAFEDVTEAVAPAVVA